MSGPTAKVLAAAEIRLPACPHVLGSTVVPPPLGDTKDPAVTDPNGEVPSPFVFHLIHAVGGPIGGLAGVHGMGGGNEVR